MNHAFKTQTSVAKNVQKRDYSLLKHLELMKDKKSE